MNNEPLNHSEPGSRRQARENVCELVTIGFDFTSDWLRMWREIF